MKIITSVFILSIVSCSVSCAQSYEDLMAEFRSVVVINKEDTVIKAGILTNEYPRKVQNDLFYYWYKSFEIHKTRGGVAGKVLHGQYSSFYPNEQLWEMGTFKAGLKSGLWKTWYASGQLMKMVNWKKGRKHGRFFQFNPSGDLSRKGKYRGGRISGRVKYYQNDTLVKIETYRKGQLKKTKVFDKEKPELKEKRDQGKRGFFLFELFKNKKKKDKTEEEKNDKTPEEKD